MVSREEVLFSIRVLFEREATEKDYRECEGYENLESLGVALRRRQEYRMAEAKRLVRTLNLRARSRVLEEIFEHRMSRFDLAERAESLLALIRPYTPVGLEFIRIGGPNDGGYVLANHCLTNTLCFSLGIGPDASFDQHLANLGCRIEMFDHTVDAPPKDNSNFEFHKIGLSATETESESLLTLESMVRLYAPAEEKGIVLKVDVEGDEWGALDVVKSETLRLFSQIAIEFHGFCEVNSNFEQKKRVLEKLNSTHKCIHFHCNNYAFLEVVGNVPMPRSIELTYLRNDLGTFELCPRQFPTKLDAPNDPKRPDIKLAFDYSLSATDTEVRQQKISANPPS